MADMNTLILASSSPRRRQMLSELGYRFSVYLPDIAESVSKGESPVQFALRTAEEKAAAVEQRWMKHGDGTAVILAADTVVSRGRRIFGKPGDSVEAATMLRSLSGRYHRVTTAICLRDTGTAAERVKAVSTRVLFKELSEEEISRYVATGEPMDKAGAYGIQGAAAFMVRAINGSYTNVVGLPLCEVTEWLSDWNISPALRNGQSHMSCMERGD